MRGGQIRGGRYQQESRPSAHLRVGIADDPLVALHREIAGITARMDHLTPLVGKVDDMRAELHNIDKNLTEVRADLKNLSTSLSNMAKDLKHNTAIFWSRMAAIASIAIVVVMIAQLYFTTAD